MEKLLKLIVVDVDGTMTDGGIYYDENGNETKKFNTKDAAGFFAAHRLGIKIMVLTGRECKATARRMEELKVDFVFQNIKNKTRFLKDFMQENHLEKSDVGYIGDDLNDLEPMQLVGYVGCPADSCAEIIAIADYVSKANGGYGAVRDVIEHYLQEKGLWDETIKNLYGNGV